MSDRRYFVYIVASPSRTLYVGVTNNLERRVSEHKSGTIPGFTAQYSVTTLVYFEEHSEIKQAIDREKQIKSWRRYRKIKLIESMNAQWNDLSDSA
ncbi:MAG: GIY-YIG nuclease family protein [Candidatus Binataceae bacterium]